MKVMSLPMIVATILLFIGCNEDSVLAPTGDLLVVQAYLYANEPVDDIRVTMMLPLDAAQDSEMPPVNDATVLLSKDGQRYALTPSPGDSGYYHYDGSDLSVAAGDHFKLEVEYQNQLIAAETTVPQPPLNVSLSDAAIEVPSPRDIFQGGLEPSDFNVTINWDNEENDYFFITIENLEDDPVPVNEEVGGFLRTRHFQPTRRDELTLNALQFTHLGTYLVKVYRVNREYADLYDSQDQDSRSLNEPLSNIENGLGVFSAFHSNVDSLFLEAVAY